MIYEYRSVGINNKYIDVGLFTYIAIEPKWNQQITTYEKSHEATIV